jgi:hypothetical protein
MKAAAMLAAALALGTLAGAQERLTAQSGSVPTPGQHRILHLVPAFDVAAADAPYRPLTAKRKFTLAADQIGDRFTLFKAAVGGALGQATDLPEYGQGWDAYGARVGASAGDATFYGIFSQAVFPVVLKQDPRYFRLGSGTSGHRVGYALSRVLVTRGDSGRPQPNASRWLGSLAGAGMSYAYYPAANRTVRKTFARAGVSVAIDAGVNVLKEFWPELRGKLSRRPQRRAP